MASNTALRPSDEFDGASDRKRSCFPSPTSVVESFVKLKVERKWIVAFDALSGLVMVMFGGRVTLVEGVTLNTAFDAASNDRYWTVDPLIQFLTSVTDEVE